MPPKSAPSVIQYWAWAATVGVALAYAKQFGVRYRISRVRTGLDKGLWKATKIS